MTTDKPRKAALVVNTRSRTGEAAFFEAVDRLEDLGVEIGATFAVRDPSRISETVKGVLEGGSEELIILGGGDGAVSSVVDFLAGTDTVLGLLPLGTANDFARTLGIPTGVAEACEAIARGKMVDVDLSLAGDNYYVNVASVGLSVGVTRALSSQMKKRMGATIAYPVAAMKAFFTHEPFDAKLSFPNGDHEPIEHERLLQVAIGNGRFYGGGLAVSPGAGMDDGTLDVYTIEMGRHRDLFGIARYLRSGDFIDYESVEHYVTKKVRLETDPAQKINIDGEVVVASPENFSVEANALKVMVPESSNAATFDGEQPR